MARKIEVEVVADTRQLERSFKSASRSTASFARQLETSGGKAGTAFSTAFAAKAFAGGIAGSAALAGVTSVVKTAAESEQILGQVKVALESTGKSWESYGAQIEAAIAAQSRLGFDDEELLKTFTAFQRRSGDVTKALQENALAVDVARGRFISLEQAAAVVQKAALGQAGALRRLGIDVAGASTATELLALLTQKYGGAAKAAANDGSTAFARTQVSIENAQEAIGNLLLPTVGDLADGLADAADTAAVLTGQLQALGTLKIPTIQIPFTTVQLPGTGTDLGEIFGKGVKLGAKAQFLGPSGLIASELIKRFRDDVKKAEPIAKDAQAAIDKSLQGFVAGLEKGADTASKKATTRIASFGQKGFKALKTNELGEKMQAQFDSLLDALGLKFDQGRLAGSTSTQLSALKETEDAIRARINANGKTSALLRQLFDVQQQRQGVFDQIADKAKSAAAAQKQRLEEIAESHRKTAEKAAEVLQTTQFRALGLDATGNKPTPGGANLKKQLASLTGRLVDADKLTPKLEAQLAQVGKVLNDGFGEVQKGSREKIRDLFAAIRGEFDGQSRKPLTKTRNLLSSIDLSGLSIPENELKTLQSRLSQFNTAGVALAQPNAAAGFAVGGGVPRIDAKFDVYIDGQQVEATVTRRQQKKTGKTGASTRGRFGGKNLGLG